MRESPGRHEHEPCLNNYLTSGLDFLPWPGMGSITTSLKDRPMSSQLLLLLLRPRQAEEVGGGGGDEAARGES